MTKKAVQSEVDPAAGAEGSVTPPAKLEPAMWDVVSNKLAYAQPLVDPGSDMMSGSHLKGLAAIDAVLPMLVQTDEVRAVRQECEALVLATFRQGAPGAATRSAAWARRQSIGNLFVKVAAMVSQQAPS